MQFENDQRREHGRQYPADRAACLLQKHRRDGDQHAGQTGFLWRASFGWICSAGHGEWAAGPWTRVTSFHPALQARGLLAAAFRSAEHLAIEADPLEPVMQAEQIGEAHAAMRLG